MRIAVCDDSEKDRRAVLQILNEFQLEAEAFDSGEALQAAFWKQEYDLVLLDIELPHTDGYELAAVLKGQSASCEIVFITDHLELVLDSFRFKPAGFVPKQLLKKELPRVLKRIQMKGTEKQPVYVSKKKSQKQVIKLSQILYLKYVYDHEVEFTLKDGSHFSEMGTMKEFEAQLGPRGFIRIYSNCLVNALYITRVERDFVALSNGEQLIVARDRRETVRKAYMQYLMGE